MNRKHQKIIILTTRSFLMVILLFKSALHTIEYMLSVHHTAMYLTLPGDPSNSIPSHLQHLHNGATSVSDVLLTLKFEQIGKTEILNHQKYQCGGITVFGFMAKIGAHFVFAFVFVFVFVFIFVFVILFVFAFVLILSICFVLLVTSES